ncbi:hypothetical protein ABZS61_12980 [Streptomyces sp. NPDC005566]|uniref:hypothetical protein n=1 Tax=Streptomyces sp. NPDC005566 TaxID=3156886 RepID=UPI00339EB79B
MKVRTTVMAATATVLCLTAVACGPDDSAGKGNGKDSGKATGKASASQTPGADAGSAPGPAPTSNGKTLTEAELTKVALANGELPDYDFATMPGGDERGTEQSENAACRPIASIINGSPEPAPAATVFRTAMDVSEEGQDDQTVVTEILTSHAPGEAERLLSTVRDAVKACAGGFRTTSDDGPSTYTEVKALPAPEAGQEALAYQVTGSIEGEGVPLVFQLVRTGSTVVTFYAANFTSARTPEVPAALVTAQAAKLP